MTTRRGIMIRFILSGALLVFVSSSCMMMGMRPGRSMMDHMPFMSVDEVQELNKSLIMDQVIAEAVSDLAQHGTDVRTMAVWGIKSRTAGLDVETIRRKLIAELVDLGRFTVVSRERLNELLEEQSLSLSGAIDESSAVAIGRLIGVGGFIDGYATIANDRLTLSFTLVDTESGIIVWAGTFDGPPAPPL